MMQPCAANYWPTPRELHRPLADGEQRPDDVADSDQSDSEVANGDEAPQPMGDEVTPTASDGQALAACAAATIQECTNEAIKEVTDIIGGYNFCATVPPAYAQEFLSRVKEMTKVVMAGMVETAVAIVTDENGLAKALVADCDAVNEGRSMRRSSSSKCHTGVSRGGSSSFSS